MFYPPESGYRYLTLKLVNQIIYFLNFSSQLFFPIKVFRQRIWLRKKKHAPPPPPPPPLLKLNGHSLRKS